MKPKSNKGIAAAMTACALCGVSAKPPEFLPAFRAQALSRAERTEQVAVKYTWRSIHTDPANGEAQLTGKLDVRVRGNQWAVIEHDIVHHLRTSDQTFNAPSVVTLFEDGKLVATICEGVFLENDNHQVSHFTRLPYIESDLGFARVGPDQLSPFEAYLTSQHFTEAAATKDDPFRFEHHLYTFEPEAAWGTCVELGIDRLEPAAGLADYQATVQRFRFVDGSTVDVPLDWYEVTRAADGVAERIEFGETEPRWPAMAAFSLDEAKAAVAGPHRQKSMTVDLVGTLPLEADDRVSVDEWIDKVGAVKMGGRIEPVEAVSAEGAEMRRLLDWDAEARAWRRVAASEAK
ncbi:MAG: hypothetical protein SF028_09730 [Candidatus Sumerlaeia bacterium]|nr:hypothetical protein [Candidatus Sumerlaeia bacterium]